MEFLQVGASYKLNGVLILIIMEDTHGALFIVFIFPLTKPLVLILIIMEDTHGDWKGEDVTPETFKES